MDRTEWLAWRKKGIGASDSPIIMGVSPWKTPLQLYEDKTSDEIKESSSYITNKGNEVEPQIRAWLEINKNTSFEPALIERGIFKASLDGRSGDQIAEFKYCGKEDYDSDVVPTKYWPQVQHQLMVSGARVCYYVCYAGSTKKFESNMVKVLEVVPDLAYIEILKQKGEEFWYGVVTRTPPPPSDRDFKSIKGMGNVAKEYLRLKNNIEQLSLALDEVKAILITEATKSQHPRLKCGPLKMTQVTRAGNIEYKSIPALKGLDLEPYRKSGSTYWKLDEL